MEEDLMKLLEEFRIKIDSKNDVAKQYIPMLRDYFIPYLLNNYSCDNIKSLFSEEITKNGLKNAAIYFVENSENIKSQSRLSFFLSALNTFFVELIFEKYPNSNLQKFHSFTGLMDTICKELSEKGIMLNPPESNPSITDEQFSFIVDYLIRYPAKTSKNEQEHILIKLYLLYGISPDKVALLKVSDYFPNKKIMKIPCSNRKDVNIYLELPFKLANEISNYASKRQDVTTDYLFAKKTHKKMDSGFLFHLLSKIKEAYSKKTKINDEKNTFTPTGLQKYAIVKMIEAGMNQSLIIDFTGQNQDIFSDCQEVVDEKKKLNRNRYINHMIRGIETYDLI